MASYGIVIGQLMRHNREFYGSVWISHMYTVYALNYRAGTENIIFLYGVRIRKLSPQVQNNVNQTDIKGMR